MINMMEKVTILTNKGQVFSGTFGRKGADGRGIMKYPNGSISDGDWVEDVRHGKNYFYEKDGEIFQGDYNKWNKEKGNKTHPCGTRYEGGFLSSLFNGPGVFTDLEGNEIKSQWQFGVRKIEQTT